MNIKRSSKVIMALLLAASALFTTELMARFEETNLGGPAFRW